MICAIPGHADAGMVAEPSDPPAGTAITTPNAAAPTGLSGGDGARPSGVRDGPPSGVRDGPPSGVGGSVVCTKAPF
jgi:hypothetical protein